MTYDDDLHAGRAVGLYMGLTIEETGDWEQGDIRLRGTTSDVTHLVGADGGLRAGALLTMVDSVAGFCAGLASLPDGWVVTTNLQLRIHRPATRVRLESTVLRRGRRAIVTGCDVVDEDGVVVADGILTSAVLVPEGGPPQWSRPARLELPGAHAGLPPLLDAFGIRAGDTADETVLDVSDHVRNPWGFVHGGVLATLVDVTADRATQVRIGGEATTSDVVMHYLAPARVGPIVGRARVVAGHDDAWVSRVELRDAGAGDRVVSVAVTTTRPVSVDARS